MTQYRVAPTYKDWHMIKVKDGKALMKQPCPRCGGKGLIIARVENDQLIPIPVDGGVCYKCNGNGYIEKWVKTYTEKEYDNYIKAQERAREKKEAERKAQVLENEINSEKNREEILAKMGFDAENPGVYVVVGENTYNIKDELKERGGRYNPTFGWHFLANTEPPQGYSTVFIPVDDIYVWQPQNKRFFIKDNAKDTVEQAKLAAMPESTSEFVGEEKERMRDIKVRITSARAVSSRFGESVLFTFDYEGNRLVWFTSAPPDEEDATVGKEYYLTGTVKKHEVYNGIKQTQLSRCKLKELI